MKKQRLFYLDLIRAVALVCILVIHFNAAVTGYFTLPSKLFGSVLPFNIYLGDFGSSLFFMVSGAALQYTSPGQGREPLNLARFYQKRAKAVYPMFWLAWCIFFPIRFVTKPGYYAAAKTPSLLLTVLGLDNFAQAAGWVTMDFACVGEWFLGSILFLYLLFPLLRWGLRKQPLLTWVVVLAAYVVALVVCWARALQLYIMAAFAPIPLAFLGMDATRQIGLGYLKSFGAVCIAGVIILVLLISFPLVLGGLTGANPGTGTPADAVANGLTYALQYLAMCVLLILALVKSGSWARDIVSGF